MFKLRPYQTNIIDETRQALRKHNSVLIQAPTGSGKTALSAAMAGTASRKNKRTFFICHRAELIEQTSITFNKVGIPHGFIASGVAPDPFQTVQVCSIDTLKSRVKTIKHPDFCIWDESHHVGAAGWAKVHSLYSKAKHVGLTATPERLDGKGLGEWFTHMVIGPTPEWLIKNGYLCDYNYFAPNVPDLTGVHTSMGDFKKNELNHAMDSNVITGDAIKHYMKLARGKRAVVFCVGIKHSKHVVEQFKAAGIVAVHIDGTMAKHDRKAAIDGFRSGTIQILSNVDIVGEGFDLPAIEASILLRPTKSLALFLQQVGRALRPKEDGSKAVILDHTGNFLRHGFPDDEREWTLGGHQRKGRGKKEEGEEVNIKQCPKCFNVHKPMPRCPSCGHIYEVKGRELDQVDDDLVELDREAIRKQQRKEQGRASSLEDLVELGIKRGYKSPHAWAAHIWTAREAKRGRVRV